MSKIALAAAIVALTVAVPLTMERAGATQLVPAAAPPWGFATPATAETSPVPTLAATPAMQLPQTSGASGTTTPTHAVFLHAGPSGEQPVIRTLRPGEPLRILANAPGGWVQVETPAGSGWAYGNYLAPASTAVVQPPAPPEEVIGQ